MTKMKITRKDILELVEGIRDVEKGMGWRLWRAGAYTHGGKVSLFAAYHGQGLDSVVYNEAYDDICEFADVIEDEDYTDEDRISLILDRIADLEMPEVRKSIPVRLDEGLHKEFMKRLIDDGMSAQKFLEARIIEYVGDKVETAPRWILDDEDWYENVTGYWNGEPVVVDMVTGSVAFVDEGEGLALDCEGGCYHAVVEAGKWAYHHDPNPPADTVEWDGDDEIARAAGWSDEDEDED